MTAPQMDLFAVRRALAEKRDALETLAPIARELATRAGEHGVTVSDLRLVAVRLGLIPQKGDGRALSYLGAVMKAAGLVASGRTRRSDIAGSHGNRHTVWILEDRC
jgi:hypothetical protein